MEQANDLNISCIHVSNEANLQPVMEEEGGLIMHVGVKNMESLRINKFCIILSTGWE